VVQHVLPAWGADFALHPNAGHDLPLDDGDWVARDVNERICSRLHAERNRGFKRNGLAAIEFL